MNLPTARTDPSGLYGSVVTLVAAGLAVAAAFGVDLTAEQTEAVLTFLTVAGPVVTAIAIRRHAWAPATVEEELARPDAP